MVLSGQEARRDSLFCPDELDSLFSYFDTSSKLRSCKYWVQDLTEQQEKEHECISIILEKLEKSE